MRFVSRWQSCSRRRHLVEEDPVVLQAPLGVPLRNRSHLSLQHAVEENYCSSLGAVEAEPDVTLPGAGCLQRS
jgi:hypothetical protein